MILEATHNTVLYNFFIIYTKIRIRIAFRKVIIDGDIIDRGLPVVVLSNHMSWWDGFWIMYMNMKLFRRKFYFMMLEEQLRKHMFLNQIGGYSVKRGSKSIIESISYTLTILKDPDNMVLIFPQGKIESLYKNNFTFERGASKIVREAEGSQIIFIANCIEYFSHARPTLYISLTEYLADNSYGLEKAYNEFYQSVVQKHIRMEEK